MSSQNKLVNATSVHYFCFTLQWTFMIAFGRMVYEWYSSPSWFSFILAIIFFHYTLRFHLLERVYSRETLETYNDIATAINSKKRIVRRKIIRELDKKQV